MKLAAGAAITAVVGLVVGSITFMMIVMAVVGAPAAASGNVIVRPSEEALDDMGLLVNTYTDAAATCPGLSWPVLAGVGKVESDHGRVGGSTVLGNGDVFPSIIGVALDGKNGTANIADTDGGALDGDTTHDRAVGPMQFLPSTWAVLGRDGNGDGIASPHNIDDAAHAAAAHLCPSGGLVDVRAALFAYNHSWDYVDRVLEWAARYTGTATGFVVGAYALPVPVDVVVGNPTRLLAPHHDYPAWDVGIPVATPVFAMHDGVIEVAHPEAGRCGGTVIVAGTEGASYTYCHLSGLAVAAGQYVTAGQLIGFSGGEVGQPGAGNTTGPHLHLAIRINGVSVCPQPILWAIYIGDPINPATAPTSGCIAEDALPPP